MGYLSQQKGILKTKFVEIYDLTVHETKNKFTIKTELTRVERSELLTLHNPKYAEIIALTG